MGFAFSDVLARVLEAAGLVRGRGEAIADEVAAGFPEAGPALSELRRRLQAELDPSLNSTVITGLVAGAIVELKTERKGLRTRVGEEQRKLAVEVNVLTTKAGVRAAIAGIIAGGLASMFTALLRGRIGGMQ